MAPGDVAHVPRPPPRRWRRPVRLQGTSARGRGFAAYLPGCPRQLFIVRCAHYARGASLTAFGFVTTVPRYLPEASNSLTFVRGADRACCAPRKWLCRPTNACLCQSPHAPRRGIGVRTRQRHLAARATPKGVERAPGSGTLPPFAALTALVVRHVSDYADRLMLCLYWLPARPPAGHWRAHPAAAPCRRSRR